MSPEAPVTADRAAVAHVPVASDDVGQRLDNYLLSRLKGVPRSHIYRIVRSGEVRINSGRVGPHYRLQAGDVIRIPPVRTATRQPGTGALTPIMTGLVERVLFEDDHLLIIDKPSGLAVHGGSGIALGVIEALRRLRPQNPNLELVHRLDRDTSGCLMLAKDRRTLAAMHALIRDRSRHRIEKIYRALVRGRWDGGRRRVDAPLGREAVVRAGQRLATVGGQGRAACTEFEPEQRFPTSTCVRVRLITGRTHQARAHAAHIGHPIAGDRKYGDRDFNRAVRELGLERLFLHASGLSFSHPLDGSPVEVEAPLPEDLARVLARAADIPGAAGAGD